MTTGACRARQVVVVVYVAIRTLPRWHGVQAGKWEGSSVVVERSIRPCRDVVALLARL